jgi:hypothetical protein
MPDEFAERLRSDAEFYNAKVAGWWVWGQSSWIGDNWGKRACRSVPDIGGFSKGVNRKLPDINGDSIGKGVNRKLPNIGDFGKGVNRQLPLLGNFGNGVNRKLPDLGGDSFGKGVNRKLPAPPPDNGDMAGGIDIPRERSQTGPHPNVGRTLQKM